MPKYLALTMVLAAFCGFAAPCLAQAQTASTGVTAQPSITPVASGGAGLVWVNTSTKIYHCLGDRYYGKTRKGRYMTKAAAVAAGDKPARGKACAK